MKPELAFSERVSGSPAFPLIVEGVHHMLGEGCNSSKGDFPVRRTDSLVYATIDEDVVGVLVFYVDSNDAIRVVLAYVEPSSRRLGIFKSMWQKLVSHAEEIGAGSVTVLARDENTLLVKALKEVGTRRHGIVNAYQVRQGKVP